MAAVDTLFRERRTNALLGWGILALIAVTAVQSAVTGNHLWAAFAVTVVAVVAAPATRYRNPAVMPPWEVILLAAIPVVGRAVATLAVTTLLATYLAVAALALIVAVEIHAFTPVRMTIGFAIVLVVVATMATAGVWALARGAGAWLFGIGQFPGETEMGWEFVTSTVAGVIGGGIFEFYFRRRAAVEDRLPTDVAEGIEQERDRYDREGSA